MSPQIALYVCTLFILWLFYHDSSLRPMPSKALWIVVAWVFIVGSRPVTSWLSGSETDPNRVPVDYLEGSPIDRNIFALLIIAGAIVLLRRKVHWSRIIASNPWFFVFFTYCCISIAWADFPFVSFKRWFKDFGNVIMVLIIITERDAMQAARAVFARYTSIAIPLSVLFIKYFPNLGRYYNRWTYQPTYCGIATEKNTLGIIVYISGLFLLWDLNEMLSTRVRRLDKADLLSRLVLLLMVCWLIIVVGSSTALVCLMMGALVILCMKRPFFMRQVHYLGTYSLILGILILLIYFVPGILEAVVSVAGRNSTFTGRTDIWTDVLKEPISPLLGTGYQSFWLGSGGAHMWEKYYFHPVQAHNGYLETYLNGGLVGICLLIATLVATGANLKKDLLQGSVFGTLLFSFYVTALFYNWSEAMFSGLNLIWIILIVAALYQRPQSKPSVRKKRQPLRPRSLDCY